MLYRVRRTQDMHASVFIFDLRKGIKDTFRRFSNLIIHMAYHFDGACFFFFFKQVHETRSHARAAEEEKVLTRKQKAAESNELEAVQSPKKPKPENDNTQINGRSADEIAAEFEEFSKAISEHLSIEQMREILKANGQDSSGPDFDIIYRWLVHLIPILSPSSKSSMSL